MLHGERDPVAGPFRRAGRSDRITAVVIFIGSALYLREALTFKPFLRTEPLGPATFPLLIGGMMLMLSVALFISSLRAEERPGAAWTKYLPPLGFWVLLLAYGVVFQTLGYLLSTGLFLLLSLWLLGVRPWWRALLFAAIFTAASWYVFTALDVRLPRGEIFRN